MSQLTYEVLTMLLRCPVCLAHNKQAKMFVCCVGHNVCGKCMPKLDKCPLCNGCFRGTRNFVAESLLPHLQIIKKLLSNNKNKNTAAKKTAARQGTSKKAPTKKTSTKKSLAKKTVAKKTAPKRLQTPTRSSPRKRSIVPPTPETQNRKTNTDATKA